MLGNNLLIVAKNGTTNIVYASKSCSISTECEVQEVASPTTGAWKQYIAGRKSWTVTCSYLVSQANFVNDLIRVGNTVTLSCNSRDGLKKINGSAIVKQCAITATRGNLVQGTFSFQGSGDLGQGL